MAILGLPAGAFAIPQMQTVSEPFVWGGGGRRMTPEDIARERALGARMSSADYSPIQSPWQGLARVAENITGAFRERSADKAAQRNADASQRVLDSLINSSPVQGGAMPSGGTPAPGGINPAILSALGDPYLDPSVKQIAAQQYEQATKRVQPIEINGKLVDPATMTVLGDFSSQPEIVRLSQIANDASQPQFMRDAAQGRITALNDPTSVIPLPSGTYVGPRSGIAAALGGGDPASTSPGGAMPPSTLPPDFDFGGPTHSASGTFR